MTLRETTSSWGDELKARLTDPRLLAMWAGASLVCVLAAPFGTDVMPLTVRAPYWFASNFLAFVLSLALIEGAWRWPRLASVPPLARGLIGAAAFSLLFAGVLVTARWAFFDEVSGLPDYLEFLSYVAPVAIAVTIVVWLFVARAAQEETQANASAPPRLLKRVKPALGSQLVRMSMQDHYVEVVTSKGSQLVLMRFADALDEVEGVAGWRIHRSHWLSEAGMGGIRRENGKTFIVATDGTELPVSRTFLPALRDAGVLKRLAD